MLGLQCSLISSDFDEKKSDKFHMGLLDLFFAALVPVLKVLLLTAVGSLLAVDRIGILGQDARKHLNSVSFCCNFNYILFLSVIFIYNCLLHYYYNYWRVEQWNSGACRPAKRF